MDKHLCSLCLAPDPMCSIGWMQSHDEYPWNEATALCLQHPLIELLMGGVNAPTPCFLTLSKMSLSVLLSE